MLTFKAHGGAEFGFVTDFSACEYANMSFFAPNRKDILFHLSLRKSAGKAAVNLRQDGLWGSEIMHDVSLATAGDTVAIHIRDARVDVTLNDVEICVYDGDFPALDTVSFVNFNGGIDASTVLIAGAANEARTGEGDLQLTGFMNVEGWAVDPGLPRQDIQLRVMGLTDLISVIPVSHPEIAQQYRQSDQHVGLLASLPGRIWEAADPQTGSVQLMAQSNGLPCGAPFEVTRAETLKRIEMQLSKPIDPAAPFDGILALEHIRYGDFLSDLSDPCRQIVDGAVMQFGLQDFLAQPNATEDETSDPPLPALPALSPNAMLLIRVRTRFAEAIRTKSEDVRHIEILRDILAHNTLAVPLLSDFLLSLVDKFCTVDQFEDLFDFGTRMGVRWFEVGENVWYNSVIVPFLYMENRITDVREAFWKLASDTPGWLATPSISWTMRKLLSENWVSAHEKHIEDISFAFMAVVEERQKNYWAPTTSQALIDATVCMMQHMHRMPEYFEDLATAFALRIFGLSRRFWETYRQSGAAGLSERLDYGGTCFDIIAAYASGTKTEPVALDRAFAFFHGFNPTETLRYQRELLGPSEGVTDGSGRLDEARVLSTKDHDDMLLRYFAFPGQAEGPSDQTTRHVCMAMRDKYLGTSKGVNTRQQERVLSEITALLDQVAAAGAQGQATDWQPPLKRILDRLSILNSLRSNFFGMGVGISLLDCLLRLKADDMATSVMSWIGKVRGDIPPDHLDGLFSQPAIFSALERLARGPESELARATLQFFPRFVPPSGGAASEMETWTGVSHVTPLYDTIVTVFSCRPYLDTRIPPMRDGWLSQLEKRGIPYIIVVGDGDGQRDGDVVYLDTPDDYEGLPQKTLAAAKWIHDTTPFTYMYKIDDDCFVDVDQMFGALTHRKFDYYGRTLTRTAGQTDRVWHFSKSTSERGRKELDKSPEPAEYTDGGSGYFLSRRAMHKLSEASQTIAGQQLIRSSFMEDKMVGDLLHSQHITPSNEDYHVSIRRRTHSGAEPVPLWENSFHPGPSSIVKQLHLDTHAHQADAMARSTQPGLWPRKLWPTFAPVRLGYNSNALELISPEAKLEQLNAAPVAAVACMRNEMFMLPHFLAHYRKLGVQAFLIADNCSDDGTLEYLLEQPDVVTFSVDTDYGQSEYGVAWQLTLMANLRVGRWSLVVDADELLVYPNWTRTKLPKLLSGKAFRDADAARIYMLDMYPKGPLSEADFSSGDPFAEAGFVEGAPFLRATTGRGPYCNSDTMTSALRHRLLPWSRPELFVAQKYALLKYQPWMRPSAGFHYVGDIKTSKTEMVFAHFKYTAHFRQKALDEVTRGQHFNNAEEYRKYLALMSEGREVIYDPDLSVPWDECAEVKQILSGA
ncbi:glycosyltransferase family 2 protein [uncultured Tateyamaria sp.]|uniref:glycosyltransferase family 2 protein n=1 Tax=uncultured Tateyamaria sp. TaxID=455651 RepID=UPI00263943AC|nr:glycosyltransferase family 2 protein [uncultured Tateyamaria sp.]